MTITLPTPEIPVRPLLADITDPQTELATLRTQTAHLQEDLTKSWCDQTNTLNQIYRLRTKAHTLQTAIDTDDERIDRLIAAAHRLGNTTLTALAYLIHGPAAIGAPTLYRLTVTHFGFTQHDAICDNVLAADLPAARAQLTRHIDRTARLWACDPAEYEIETLAL